MAVVRPFRGIRPTKELAHRVACLPYDVMNREEAKEMAKDNPYSFLHVGRSEIDLDPSISPYDPMVYQKARDNLDQMLQEQILMQDALPIYYIYRQIMDGRAQTGIVSCTSIDEYMDDSIKKHEYTRPEKEQDRINNFDYCDANTEPIFLTYRSRDEIDQIVDEWTQMFDPIYNFTSEDQIIHRIWMVDRLEIIQKISGLFNEVDYLYIADGHHRSASAVKVGLKRRQQYPDYKGYEEFNYFLSVIFPDKDLYIMDYNRVIKDLNGYTEDGFMERIKDQFHVEVWGEEGPYKPEHKHTFGMFLGATWYKLVPKEKTYDENDPILSLDVSILQNNLLDPILGIDNPRTNKRIDFVGGIRGLYELEKRVSTDMMVAFSMYATTIDDLLTVADSGKVMPPKSTWFEPKLRSGLFVHRLY